MARRPISMNKRDEILRLKGLGLKERKIARCLNISRNTVRKYLKCDSDTPIPLEVAPPFSWDDNALGRI